MTPEERKAEYKHLRVAIQSLALHLAMSAHGRGSSVFDEERLAALEYLRTLAPDDGPPAQVDRAVCGTCKGKRYVESLSTNFDSDPFVRKPCPSCTPAAASAGEKEGA
jgi:hypothetical protein